MLSKASPRVTVTEQHGHHPVYSAVAPLRMLNVRERSGDTWEMVDKLMDHLGDRRLEAKWSYVIDQVIPVIRDQCGHTCNTQLIERIIGIFRTNSVKWERKLDDDTGTRMPIWSS